MTQIAADIWTASGPQVSVIGFHYPTRMTVIRLADRKLLIWSPIALTPGLMQDIEALGTVAFVVAPNTLHHLFVADWGQAFPQAKVLAPKALRAKRPGLRIDADLDDRAPSAWDEVVEMVAVGGNLITTEFVIFHRPSRTAIFTDLIQQFPLSDFKGWRRVIARLDRMAAPTPEVPRKFRNAFLGRKAARHAIRQILRWPADRVIMAHGPTQEAGGRETIARAFRWLVSR